MEFLQTKRYMEKKVSLESNSIKVYDYKGNFLFSYNLTNKKIHEKTILFRYGNGDAGYKEKCLIFYDKFDVHDKMEFRENIKNKNILIIQNPEFIVMWKELNKS